MVERHEYGTVIGKGKKEAKGSRQASSIGDYDWRLVYQSVQVY